MSKQVDERVVEMRFDNKNFENNVKTTMSTIDKLKEKLSFKGASKGLETLNTSVKKVDMSSLGRSAETVGLRFNAMYTMADQALRNITSRVQHTAESMVKALTLDPITTGFQEYETQINAVQTILANTSAKGTTIDQVNKALEELNLYADKTIYNFTEMTRNIGTFTAAGVDLDTSVSAIQGIANLAAVSGSTSQQASTAMYQLSQALATGTVKLMDWNSVVNAGMGGEVFQNALKRTATAMGTNVDALIEKYGSFRDSLTKGEWITSEVLTKTLEQFTMAAEEGSEAWENYKKSLMEEGYTEAQAIEILKMANTATDAATKVKTFTQLWDVLKESAQSGWSQTWKLIIGDFEEAKGLLTPLADFFTGALNKMSDARNKLLDSALSKGFMHMIDGIGDAINTTKKGIDGVLDPIKKASGALDSLGSAIDAVMGGELGNGKERFDALTKAGINYCEVQNKINESLGNSFRYTKEQIDAQNKLLGKQTEATKSTEKQSEAVTELTEKQKNQLKNLLKMSEEQLKSKGYTDEQIKSLRELGEQAKKLGLSTDEFIDNIEEINGRWLLINSFKNVGKSLVKIFTAMGEAYREIFPPMQADQLFNIIAALHKFSTRLVMSDESAGKLKRTLKGVFALIDIVTTVVGGGFKLAFKAVKEILSYFNMDILDVTAAIGDAIVGFRDWVKGIVDFHQVLDVVVPVVKSLIDFVKGLVNSFMDIPYVQGVIERFSEVLGSLKDYDWTSVGKDLIEGFTNGLGAGIKNAFSKIVEFGKNLLEKFCYIIGVQSPSWKMFDIAIDFVQGFINGLAQAIGNAITAIKDFGGKLIDAFKNLKWPEIQIPEGMKQGFEKFKEYLKNFDYSKLLALIPIGVVLIIVKKVYDVISAFADGINGLNEVIDNFALIEKKFADVLGGFANNLKAEALKKVAIAIAILVASVIALTLVDQDKLLNATAVIVVLSGVLIGLAFAMDKMSKTSASFEKGKFSMEGFKSGLIQIGAAILLLGIAVKLIGSMNRDQAIQGFIGLAAIMTAMLIFIGAVGLVGKRLQSLEHFDKVGKMLTKISFALLLMVGVCKLAGMLTVDEMLKGGAFLAAFGIFVGIITAIAKSSGNNVSKAGGMILKITVAMLMLVGICKLVGMLEKDEMLKGAAFAGAMLIFVGLLVAITKIGKKQQIAKLGGLLLAISTSLLIMVGVCKLVGKLTVEEMIKGGIFMGAFIGLVALMVKILKISNEQQMAKVAGTILAFSVAIGILAAVSILMSMMTWEGLAKGVGAVTILGLTMAAMTKALKGANNVVGSLIVMTVAIAIMAGAVAALSTIDGNKLIPATVALSMVMGMFALIEKEAIYTRKATGTLIVMTLAVGLIGGVLYILAQLPAQQTLASAAALSLVLISVGGCLAILSKMVTNAKNALMGVLALTAMAVPLLAFVGILALMQNIQNATNNALALVGMATALTLMLIPLSAVGLLITATRGTAMLGIVALLAMAVPLAAFVGVLALMENIQNATANTNLLISLMNVLTNMVVKISLLAPLLTLGVIAIQGLVLLIVEVGILATALGALMEKFPGIEDFINRGLPILEQLAGSIGTMVGNLVNGFASAVASGLPEIGTQLSEFMTNVTPFINGAKLIDETVLQGVAYLSGAIVLLTAADLIAGLTSFLPFSSSFAQLGADLSMFMMNATPFLVGAMAVGPEVMEGIKSLAEAILVLTAANVVDGITKFVTGGDSSLASFGAQLGGLGSNLNTFATNLGTFDETKVATIRCAAEAIKIMAEAAGSLPNEGGWAAKILGENSIGAFGAQLGGLGTNLNQFVTNLGTFTEEQVNTVTCAANAIKALAQAAAELPNDGGWVGKILGENSIGAFGEQLGGLGTNLSTFASNLGTFNEDQVATVTCAANAIKTMAQAADGIPNEGGWAAKIFGDNSLSTFGTAMEGLGTNLANFVMNLGTFTEAQVSTVRCAVSAVKAFAALGETDLSSLKKNLEGFGDKLGGFGSDIGSFCENMPEAASISSATSSLRKIVSTLSSISAGATESAKNFGESLKKLAKSGVKSFTKAFSGGEAKADVKDSIEKFLLYAVKQLTSSNIKETMKQAGIQLVEKILEGVESKKSDAETVFGTIPESGASSIDDYYDDFYSAGSDLVSGFVAGISDNISSAASAAAAMASAAAAAAKANLQINSPSKVFRAIGTSVPEGFAQGIGKLGYMIKDASAGMSDTAIAGLKGSISRITDAINTDIDAHPVISPVLDLSNVESGAATIGGMFGNVGMTARVNTLSSMMNGYSQNGGNDDVVSAINKLRNDLGNVRGDTYQIDGVTYDDGSNISNTVKSLVRAVRRERRI